MSKPKRRKIEVYRLIISGLKDDADYLQLLRRARTAIKEELNVVQTGGDKSHALHEVKLMRGSLWLRFYSYSEGERPDVINTKSLNIKPNPLSDNETQVYWTHALISPLKKRVVMLTQSPLLDRYPTSDNSSYGQSEENHPSKTSRPHGFANADTAAGSVAGRYSLAD